MTTTEPLSDPRDMFMIHTVFRREFGLMPDLVNGVEHGDLSRASVVADHVELVDKVLHHHHGTEDQYIWPKLLTRVPHELEPVVHTMETQHAEIDKVNTELVTALNAWRATASVVDRSAVLAALDQLLPLLDAHLTLEEDRVVPLIAQHITAREWGEMVSDGALDVDPSEMPLLFGMAMYEGDPEIVEATIQHMPPELRPVIGPLGTEAFAAHSLAVHGTATPPKITST
jgi:hemerythrin-like domain-containing protein